MYEERWRRDKVEKPIYYLRKAAKTERNKENRMYGEASESDPNEIDFSFGSLFNENVLPLEDLEDDISLSDSSLIEQIWSSNPQERVENNQIIEWLGYACDCAEYSAPAKEIVQLTPRFDGMLSAAAKSKNLSPREEATVRKEITRKKMRLQRVLAEFGITPDSFKK